MKVISLDASDALLAGQAGLMRAVENIESGRVEAHGAMEPGGRWRQLSVRLKHGG